MLRIPNQLKILLVSVLFFGQTLISASAETLHIETLMRLMAENSDDLAIFHLRPALSRYDNTTCSRLGAVTSSQGVVSFTSDTGSSYRILQNGRLQFSTREKQVTSGQVYGNLQTVNRNYRISDVRVENGIPYMWLLTFEDDACVASVAPSAGVRRCVVDVDAGDLESAFILTQEIASQIHISCR